MIIKKHLKLNTVELDSKKSIIELLTEIVLMILAGIACSSMVLGTQIPWFVPYVSAWMFAGIVLMSAIKNRNFDNLRLSIVIAIIMLTPFVILVLWTVILWTFEVSGLSKISRSISLFIQYLSIAVFVFGLILRYGKQAVNRLLIIISIVYCISVISCLIMYGSNSISVYIANMAIDDEKDPAFWTYQPFFEMHDICLAAPLFVFYYLTIDKDNERRWLYIGIAVVVSLLGFKRVALLAFGIVLGAYGISLIPFVKRHSARFAFVLQVLIMLMVCVWVIITSNSVLIDLLSQSGINLMGRNVIYDYFSSYGGIDLTNLGQGLGFCGLELERIADMGILGSMSSVRGLHNDLLRIIIEVGTVVGFIWLVLKIFLIPTVLKKYYGESVVLYYSLLLFYAFIVYMTDNTMGYIVFQTSIFVILGVAILKLKEY